MRFMRLVSPRIARMISLGALVCGLLFSLVYSTSLLVSGSPTEQNVNQNPEQNPVPTLVPPTLVPTVESGMIDALPSESAVARIQRDSQVRVGILYNEPPFGELNIRGEVSGFDADLARAMGEAWGVEVEFVQVTRQTAIDVLRNGNIDMLLAAQPHRRELDDDVEFSQTYYPGNQMMLVRNDDGATVLGHMENRVVGVVLGTRGEQAVADWLGRSGLPVTVRQYLTIDQALSALLAQEVDGVVENRLRLERAIREPELVRFVEEPVSPEPYAIAIRRQDVNMRNLVNRTLQYLYEGGKLNEIHQANFDAAAYPGDIPVWSGLGEDAPNPSQFATDIPFPAQYVVPRLQNDRILRVAGVADLPDDADESQRRIDALNRSVIEAMAARWGMGVEYIDNSVDNALELVATGQADIAVGIEPTWDWADRVDFTDSYMMHGKRLMVLADNPATGFSDLRGELIGYFASEPESDEEMTQAAEEARSLITPVIIVNEEDAAFGMMVQDNWHAVYGDSLKLLAHLQANPNDVRLVTNEINDGWWTRHYLALATPRNDIDFRLLVEYTLQEIQRDGTLTSLLQPVMLPDDIPTFDIWPGPSDYLGFNLASRQG